MIGIVEVLGISEFRSADYTDFVNDANNYKLGYVNSPALLFLKKEKVLLDKIPK